MSVTEESGVPTHYIDFDDLQEVERVKAQLEAEIKEVKKQLELLRDAQQVRQQTLDREITI
jgi:hypothetical protein